VGGKLFPSVWRGDFRSKAEYDAASGGLGPASQVFDWLDDRVLHSRHPFSYRAYCAVCEAVTPMRVGWEFAGSGGQASVNPAWTETAGCERCGLNSRMRALIDFLKTRSDLSAVRRAYAAEQTTPSFRVLQQLLPSLVGSEYLGPDHKSGETLTYWRKFHRVRHEDLTALSAGDAEFDIAITQDVFEHVPDYRRAFAELARVLSAQGTLVFTIPFFAELAETRVRATVGAEGVKHLLPPEIHGNPVSSEGSLCFQNFGWDILDDLRGAGFADAFAALYWGPWQGHLGFPFFVFSASKDKR
jgi:hypothetical protein